MHLIRLLWSTASESRADPNSICRIELIHTPYFTWTYSLNSIRLMWSTAYEPGLREIKSFLDFSSFLMSRTNFLSSRCLKTVFHCRSSLARQRVHCNFIFWVFLWRDMVFTTISAYLQNLHALSCTPHGLKIPIKIIYHFNLIYTDSCSGVLVVPLSLSYW